MEDILRRSLVAFARMLALVVALLGVGLLELTPVNSAVSSMLFLNYCL